MSDQTEQEEGVLSREDMQAVGPRVEDHPSPEDTDEGVLSREDMEAKKEKGSEGLWDTSESLGTVVSDTATDAAGRGPEDLRQVGEDDEGVLGEDEEGQAQSNLWTPDEGEPQAQAQSTSKSSKKSSRKS